MFAFLAAATLIIAMAGEPVMAGESRFGVDDSQQVITRKPRPEVVVLPPPPKVLVQMEPIPDMIKTEPREPVKKKIVKKKKSIKKRAPAKPTIDCEK